MRESREGRRPRRRVWGWASSRRALAGILLALVTAIAPGATPVSGSLRVGGKPLTLRHAWIVRGPDRLENSAIRTYVVMTTEDVSADISKCPNLDCALFDSVKSGLVLGLFPAGYWLRAVHPEIRGEKQFSGPSQSSYGWKPRVQEHGRAAGRLLCEFEPIVCDLEVDAALLREFPAEKPTPGR